MAELGFPLAAILIEKPRLRCFRGDLLGVKADLQKLGCTMSAIRDCSFMTKRSKPIIRSYAVGYDNFKMCLDVLMICWRS
ncbi:hypothetical protein ACFX15_008644 [Malus domestica]